MKRLKTRRLRKAVERRQEVQASTGKKPKARYRRFIDFIQRLETNPLAKMIAFVAAFVTFALPLWQIYLDAPERQAERVSRAWQSLTTPATGNSGKSHAIEYLVNQGTPLEGLDLSCKAMSGGRIENSNCRSKTVIRELNLVGKNLSRGDFSGTDFSYSNLRSADLSESIFINSVAKNVDFSLADLDGVVFDYADLSSSTFDLDKTNGAPGVFELVSDRLTITRSNVTRVHVNFGNTSAATLKYSQNYIVGLPAFTLDEHKNYSRHLPPDFICSRGFRDAEIAWDIQEMFAPNHSFMKETFEEFLKGYCKPIVP